MAILGIEGHNRRIFVFFKVTQYWGESFRVLRLTSRRSLAKPPNNVIVPGTRILKDSTVCASDVTLAADMHFVQCKKALR